MNTPTDQAKTIGQIEARNVARLVGLNYVQHDPAKRTRWEMQLAKTWGSGQRAEWEMGMPICRGCAAKIDPTPFNGSIGGQTVTLPVSVCEDCMRLVREHYNGETDTTSSEVSLTPKWDELCPPRFQQVICEDVEMPGTVDLGNFKRVKAWRPANGKGLAIYGQEGSGKSLSLWALARELEREERAPVVISGVELGRVLAKAARDIESVEWLAKCRVLMIDDLGKEKATAAVGALLWELLDARYQHNRPVILTTRFAGEALRDRFNEPYLGDDIRRRLNELCVGVKFSLPTAQEEKEAA